MVVYHVNVTLTPAVTFADDDITQGAADLVTVGGVVDVEDGETRVLFEPPQALRHSSLHEARAMISSFNMQKRLPTRAIPGGVCYIWKVFRMAVSRGASSV